MKKLVAWGLKLLRISVNEEQLQTIVQFIGFCIVGGMNTLISFATYSLLLWLVPFFQIGKRYIIANGISFFVSVTNSFFWNNRFVFRSGEGEIRKVLPTYLKTVVSYAGTGLILSNILLYLAVDRLGWNQYLSNLAIIIITIPINFIMNKLWAFKSKKSSREEENQ